MRKTQHSRLHIAHQAQSVEFMHVHTEAPYRTASPAIQERHEAPAMISFFASANGLPLSIVMIFAMSSVFSSIACKSARPRHTYPLSSSCPKCDAVK